MITTILSIGATIMVGIASFGLGWNTGYDVAEKDLKQVNDIFRDIYKDEIENKL